MSTVPPATRQRNVVTFVLLILFAIGLCVLVLWSMRLHTLRQGGTVYPPPTSLWLQSDLSSAA